MKVRWKTLLGSITMWLFVEISLELVGLDQLADYSEFLQDKYQLVVKADDYNQRVALQL